jgi:lipopolysaccharide transport system ATP-binding protein
LKILSKITYPTSGKVKIQGRVASLLEVGTGFHEELTGRENVFLNGSILGMKKREVKAKLDAIVSFAEVEKFMDTPIKRYSSGMRMRLGFAVAAHLDSEILFIDEVLSVGDAAFQKKCLGTMGDMRSSGKTVIFVSHNMPTVENLCPRVIWIHEGKIREDGPGPEVISNYLSQYSKHVMVPSSEYVFEDVFDRRGSGEIRYKSVEFMDMDGRLKSMVRSGENLKVRLHYEVRDEVLNPRFYFSFRDEKGAKIATFGSDISGQHVDKMLPGTGYVDIDIENINITPDRYYFDFWIYKSRGGQLYDHVPGCARLDVEVSNYYKTGIGIDKGLGHMFFACKWNMYGVAREFNNS